MKKKIIMIVLSIVILIGGVIGISLYFGLRDTRTELSISFYDNKTELSFGKFDYKIRVSIGSPMESGNIYYFDSEEDCKKCFEEIKKSEYLILDKGDYAVYNKDGYYFFSELSISSKQPVIILQNFFTRCVNYGFYPFFLVQDHYMIVNGLEQFKEGETVVGYMLTFSWESLKKAGGIHERFEIKDNPLEVSSKEEVLEFYSKVNPEYWKYDQQKDIIFVKSYHAWGYVPSDEDRLSKNYTMEMSFTDEEMLLRVYYDTYFD